ncbi:MAG: phage GP46 family protein [Pseudomonadota bacterium]
MAVQYAGAPTDAARRTDAALYWRDDLQIWDLAIGPDGDLAADQALRTSALVTLGTDRRAEDSDVLPLNETDRRGWWADELFAPDLPPAQQRIGSRLWLLDQRVLNAPTLADARIYAEEAFAHWVTIGAARRVEVDVSRIALNRLGLLIRIYRDGPVGAPSPSRRFDAPWGEVYLEIV